MMTWFTKNKQSRGHIERERQALAHSIEELATSEGSGKQVWSEEEEDEEVDAHMTGASALIPPALSLQSRPMPAVRVDTPRQETWQQEAASLVNQPGKRLGHSTKVHLQAVRPGQTREPITERVPILDPSGVRAHPQSASSPEHEPVLARKIALPATTSPAFPPSALFCGSGVIEKGQADATIHNPRISARSVVTVMLAGNPGPVVVHYISLQPRAGFTLHMSAPVSATTSFNYAVWLF